MSLFGSYEDCIHNCIICIVCKGYTTEQEAFLLSLLNDTLCIYVAVQEMYIVDAENDFSYFPLYFNLTFFLFIRWVIQAVPSFHWNRNGEVM